MSAMPTVHTAPAIRKGGWHWRRPVIGGIVVVGAAWGLPDFQLMLLANIGLATIVVLGVVLLTGIAGMTSFGQAAFVGVGAYTTAWLATAASLPAALAWLGGSSWAALAAGLALTLSVGVLLGQLTLRLSGHYLPLGTMAWGLSIAFLFGTSDALGGHSGLANLPALRIGPWELTSPSGLCCLVWSIVLATWWCASNLLDSRTGRAVRALNGRQAMAASMGVPVFRVKLAVFLLAAGLACVSGWLYVYTQRFVNPTPFSLGAGIDYLFMALIGGVNQLAGAWVGAAIFTLAKDALQDLLPHLLGTVGSFESVVFGVIVIILVHVAPDGVVGRCCRWWAARRGGEGASPLSRHIADAEPLARRSMPLRGSPVLTANALTRRFGGLVANHEIDLALHAGEILAVIGPNGAGKSTLFNQLSRCDEPTSGTIRFLDQDVAGWSAERVAAAGLGRTFQHVKIVPTMSVLENVALGAHLRGSGGLWRCALRLDRSEEARLLQEARLQLERVGLGALAASEAGTLSLGQQRLLEIARALCLDPSVLLLDEPAAGLRHLEKRALVELLLQLRQEGMAILIVEHDMDFVMSLVDRVAVIVFGTKIADGKPEDVRADQQVLDAYLGVD